jgi:two-component system catabolic regulation response regulator CreB/two-component system response regulator ChvI
MTNHAFKGKILIVDDAVDTLITISQGLRRHGFEVSLFSNPVDALSQFRPDHYDLAVLDVRMQRMNGFELAKKIWAKDQKIRVCFFSAFEVYEKEAQVMFEGVKTVSFVSKPISPSDLAVHINEMLQK